MSQEMSEHNVQSDSSREAMKVTLLGDGWTSSTGGLATLNRELAIQLSQYSKVDVCLLVPDGHCSDEDKSEAKKHGITVVDAKELPGYDEPLDWLGAPPEGHKMDVVVGHGKNLGRQVQFIKISSRFDNCKWVQVVHTAPEDLSKYKGYSDRISKGEKKHEVEVELCKLADLIVPIGPRLEEVYSSCLQRYKRDTCIFPITPGLFDREFGELEQSPNENAEFKVMLCGRADEEDFELKGYNLAAKAFTDDRLKRKRCSLLFVGAPEGKQEEVTERFLQCGIAEEQLTVKTFVKSREKMKDLLCEVDLAIMPSKAEGFGLVALEALSAGLPILVNSKSGFARALEELPFGELFTVNSDEPAKWAEAIEGVRNRHKKRLEEITLLRTFYNKQYSWKEQCGKLVEKLQTMVYGFSNGSVRLPEGELLAQQQSAAVASLEGESSALPAPSIHVSHVRGNIAIRRGGNAKIRAKGGGKQKLPNDCPPTGSSNLNEDYCRKSSFKEHFKETQKNWFPRHGKEILRKKGIEKRLWSIGSVLQNLDQFIEKLDTSAGVCKEQREDFILLEILVSLEQSWGQYCNGEVYKILAKISCSRNSDIVVRQALQLLHHLLFQDNFGGGSGNLPIVENILRSSIFPPEGMVGKDQHCSERHLKLNVYSHILSLQLLQNVQQPESPTLDLGQGLNMFQEKIARFCKEVKNRNSDAFRYSMEFIIETISYLLKTPEELETSKLRSFLQESQDFLKDPKKDSKDLQVLKELQKGKMRKMFANTKWIDVHYILIHLHGKVYSERPKPQMETERQAIKLIRLIIENYLNGGGGDDWRFCLLASSILVDIVKNNSREEIMLEAACCLVNLLKDARAQKTSKCRVLLERSLSEVLFCPDAKVRTLLIHFMSRNKEKALSADLHTEHLASIYRNLTLKIDNTTIFQTSNGFINRGMFQRRKVAVKILTVKLEHLLEEDPTFHARERLIREAYHMSRLNEVQHPNFPVLLAYNTESLPYHLITEYERDRDMLQFVRKSRITKPRLQPIHLFKLLIGITDALLHLEKLDLVHRAVMAENVLVGDDYVAKLSGLHALKQLRKGSSRKAAAVSSEYDYSYTDCGTLEYVSPFTDEDLPCRWKAPESLKERRYSTASDVWALGVLIYEVLTYGCLPYRDLSDDEDVISHVTKHRTIVLPPEQCFQQEEYDLIFHCCKRQIGRRPNLAKVKERLSGLRQDAEQEESRPEPPSLDISIKKERDVSSLVLEEITRGDIQHLRKLVRLNNPNLVSVRSKHHQNTNCLIVEALLPANSFGNLKDFVLEERCQVDHVVTYLSQVSSALHYLHKNHIVHGNLRAEYVYVVAQEKVQVGALGHSKTLSMTANETTGKSCAVVDEMAPHATRWSAPEVILGGRFSHASDVWAYGILSWELYQSFNFDQDSREMSVPYYNLQTDVEILSHMREVGPLDQPERCPIWVFIIMHQCWTFEPEQRPPFLAIFDCLTSSEPMESWIMKLWMQNHDEGEWPKVSVRQPTGACHVTEAEKHPSQEDIEKMCSEAFFLKHNYKYVDHSLSIDDYYASCSSGSTLDGNETLDQNLGYHEPYSGQSLDRNRSRLSPKAPSSSSRRKDDRIGKVDLLEPHLANDNTALYSNPGREASLPCNNELSLEMEEFYEFIPEPTSNTRRLSTPLDKGTLGNASCRAGCHDTGENVADPLFYFSANVSEFTGSIDTNRQEENSKVTLKESGYLQPVEHRGDYSNDTECDAAGYTLPMRDVNINATRDTLHYNSADVVGFKRPRNQSDNCSKTRNDISYLPLKPEKNFVQYQTLDFSLGSPESLKNSSSAWEATRFEDQAHLNENEKEFNGADDDSLLYDDVIGCISEGRKNFERFSRDDCQSVANQSDEDSSSEYDDVVRTRDLRDPDLKVIYF